jgi:acyl-CoA thioesterase-1
MGRLPALLGIIWYTMSAAAGAEPIHIVALGASNTVGHGVSPSDAWPAQLEALLRAKGYDVQVANAGIGGDTSSGMLARLPTAVPIGTRIVILQAGGNDEKIWGHAGMTSIPEQTIANVSTILDRLRTQQVKVLVCPFSALDHDGQEHLAKDHGAVFVEHCSDTKNMSDGIHMNATGHRNAAGKLLPYVESILGPR